MAKPGPSWGINSERAGVTAARSVGGIRSALEKWELIGVSAARKFCVPARVYAVDQRWKPLFELGECFRARADELFLAPDFVEAARVAPIAADEIGLSNAKEARNPNLDSVALCERAAGDDRMWP